MLDNVKNSIKIAILLIISCPYIIKAQPINIDQTWLDNNGPAPYKLVSPGKTYILQTDVTTAGAGFYIANTDITLDLNGYTIYYGSNNANTVLHSSGDTSAVALYTSYYHTSIPPITNGQSASRAIVKNGRIIHQGTAALAHGIFAHNGNESIFEDLYIETFGQDTRTINVNWGNSTIRNSVLIAHANTTANRHAGPSNVKNGDKLIASRNLLVGGNSAFNVGSNSQITKNIMIHSGFVTNGYGVFLYRNNNTIIRDNLILPSNGRGILWNAGNNHLAENNVILHWEAPNVEFGNSLNPPAIRARYETANAIYRNNISLGIAGDTLTAASSIYLSNYGVGVNEFTNNHATTILRGTPSILKYAQPLTMEAQGLLATPGIDLIANNQFRSNLYQLRTEGYDGRAMQASPIVGNSFDFVDGNIAFADFTNSVNTKYPTL